MKVPSYLALLVWASSAAAQTAPAATGREATQLFDGAKMIVVHTQDSVPAALQKMRDVLAAQGYELDTVRATYFTTKPRAFVEAGSEGALVQYVYRVTATPATADTELLLTGHLLDDRNPKYHFETPMRWMKPGATLVDQKCFDYADIVAKSYPAGKVAYRQKSGRP